MAYIARLMKGVSTCLLASPHLVDAQRTFGQGVAQLFISGLLRLFSLLLQFAELASLAPGKGLDIRLRDALQLFDFVVAVGGKDTAGEAQCDDQRAISPPRRLPLGRFIAVTLAL